MSVFTLFYILGGAGARAQGAGDPCVEQQAGGGHEARDHPPPRGVRPQEGARHPPPVQAQHLRHRQR